MYRMENGEYNKIIDSVLLLSQGDIVGFHIKYVNLDDHILALRQITKNGEPVGQLRYLECCEGTRIEDPNKHGSRGIQIMIQSLKVLYAYFIHPCTD